MLSCRGPMSAKGPLPSKWIQRQGRVVLSGSAVVAAGVGGGVVDECKKSGDRDQQDDYKSLHFELFFVRICRLQNPIICKAIIFLVGNDQMIKELNFQNLSGLF